MGFLLVPLSIIKKATPGRRTPKLLCGLCLSSAISLVGNAQSTGSPRDVVIESNRQEMDTLLLRKPILTASDVSVRMALLKQIGEDFRELQTLNNKMMEKVSTTQQVDYNEIAKILGQMATKASRLKTNLALPEAQQKKEKPASLEITDAAQLQGGLSKLDKTVMSFANNPIFQKVKVVDVQLAYRANGDLTTIIEQSGLLKKAATKLGKSRKSEDH